jgi:hypothetical protein
LRFSSGLPSFQLFSGKSKTALSSFSYRTKELLSACLPRYHPQFHPFLKDGALSAVNGCYPLPLTASFSFMEKNRVQTTPLVSELQAAAKQAAFSASPLLSVGWDKPPYSLSQHV